MVDVLRVKMAIKEFVVFHDEESLQTLVSKVSRTNDFNVFEKEAFQTVALAHPMSVEDGNERLEGLVRSYSSRYEHLFEKYADTDEESSEVFDEFVDAFVSSEKEVYDGFFSRLNQAVVEGKAKLSSRVV